MVMFSDKCYNFLEKGVKMTAPILNESFKALVRETFPDKSDKVISIFDEVVSNKASSDLSSVAELKGRAIDEVRAELATKDFVRAEIAEVRQEIARSKVEILKWVFGLQASTIVIILGALKFMLG